MFGRMEKGMFQDFTKSDTAVQPSKTVECMVGLEDRPASSNVETFLAGLHTRLHSTL